MYEANKAQWLVEMLYQLDNSNGMVLCEIEQLADELLKRGVTVLPQECWIVLDGALGGDILHCKVLEHEFVDSKLVGIVVYHECRGGKSTWPISSMDFGNTVFFNRDDAKARLKILRGI